jgi:hypothetical protein
MEDKNQGGHMGGYDCKMCQMMGEMHGKMCPGGHCRWSFMLIKMIVCLIVLGVVFAAGIKLGELKGVFYGEYGNSPSRCYMLNR